jgi:hypothetical protein
VRPSGREPTNDSSLQRDSAIVESMISVHDFGRDVLAQARRSKLMSHGAINTTARSAGASRQPRGSHGPGYAASNV